MANKIFYVIKNMETGEYFNSTEGIFHPDILFASLFQKQDAVNKISRLGGYIELVKVYKNI